jgi:hypothetical protein
MMEVIHSSKTLVLTTATQCNIPEDGTLHSHCRENQNLTKLRKLGKIMSVITNPSSK